MNKAELIDAMASETKMTKTDCRKALDAFLSSISKSLEDGDNVTLVGFGSWKVIQRAERTGHNPKTGEKLVIPAKKVVKFKTGSSLADNVR